MNKKKLVFVLLIMLIVVVPSFLMQTSQARASNNNSHTYSITRASMSSQAYRVLMPANFMTPGPSGPDYDVRISAEMWVMTPHGWIEGGLINGWPYWPDNKLGGHPSVAYSWFWADGQIRNGQQYQSDYWLHTIANVSPDYRTHDFAIQYDLGKRGWNIWLDGQVVGYSNLTGDSYGVAQQVGLEMNLPNACGTRSGAAWAQQFKLTPGVWSTYAQMYVPWLETGGSSPEPLAPSFQGNWDGSSLSWLASKEQC